ILQDPALPWPAIHPSAWVTERRYNERDLAESLGDFLRERQASLAWLDDLHNPDFTLTATHPAGFVISAGDMLMSWVAHDMLHIRQLNELHYQWLGVQERPFSPLYAGEW
ncbi:MAG: DinB family protein, partial [Anaerolineales bacterium]|nr:DinB family protein [Anaerolineales bacterium]